MLRKLYKQFAVAIGSYENCRNADNISPWEDHWRRHICSLCENHMPRGSGFDSGTSIDLDRSTGNKLVFNTAFHHMDPHGHYDGWTEHTVTVTASLAYDFDIKVSGHNRNGIKGYIAELFSNALDYAAVFPVED